ncbi:MAG: GNAT family N-acetyltransferase [Patescibacteria group bacterium]|nr:GNAT family N-acetyltransferase [Patescibacteria group bacterium]
MDIIPFSLGYPSGRFLALVRCYQHVFACAPWRQWQQCANPNCAEGPWGYEDRAFLEECEYQHCGLSMVDCWPDARMADFVRREIDPESSCWIAVDRGVVVGFCVGRPTTIGCLGTTIGLTPGQPAILPADMPVAVHNRIAVDETYRQGGVARALFRRFLAYFRSRGLDLTLACVHAPPILSPVLPWFKRLGYRAVAKCGDGRMVLTRPLQGLVV